MPAAPTRERDPAAKRARIATAALELFQTQGYTETTIDQIATAAGVGRRTVFHHFPSKEAILLDHLVVRREVAAARLAERPRTEPPLVSLHAVLRDLCEQGYDRDLLAQIRAVLATEPRLMAEQLSLGGGAFLTTIAEILLHRAGTRSSSLEMYALALMALSWFTTATHLYLTESRPSLLACFDEIVATCVQATAALPPIMPSASPANGQSPRANG
ncbi:TetR family transcriptional regulator [Frankia sp. CNm7]|uniref:TetR family transcriptional regulator n=1 Tax=Frankia nepalensis TaxID=1836974 RepID=A0A937RF78_9ACTN|nr:TetR/AcrR family transcriptional regulator [Frankia nepalensis]MBL7502286.1 TetR family transcriptional regulator [Frankia nepalensis]MBL7514977.1 TetR family transcriptional regulator [Frankia nepalensis]MBL7522258.1 TetR family transcriptional regulator [Frankia nepalensis]MBL7629092.1 TetR family transcriptional regulator [Frankia nepalensis]